MKGKDSKGSTGEMNKKQKNVVIAILATILIVNLAPIMSYGVEVRDMPEDGLELIERETEEGVEGGEDKQEAEEHGEESGGLSLPDEVIGEEEGAYENTEEDKLEGEKEGEKETDIIEDKETNGSYGTQTTSLMMKPQSTPTYVMAEDSDFVFISTNQNGYLVNGTYGYFKYRGDDFVILSILGSILH